MRIIAGSAKRTPLLAPKGNSIRPTGDRTRGMVFNLLEHNRALREHGFALDGASVLDACCGIGAYGLEALSRGALSVQFVDNRRESLECVRYNAERCRLQDACRFQLQDATRLNVQVGGYRLIFLDPPYHSDIAEEVLRHLAAKSALQPGGVLVLEQSASRPAPQVPGFSLLLEKSEGDSRFCFLGVPAVD